MSEKKLVFYGITILLLAALACGPEPESGAVYGQNNVHRAAASAPADTLPPPAAEEANKKMKPAAGVPSLRLSDTERNYLLGKFDPAKHSDFVEIPMPYANRKGLYMRREAFADFKKMREAARKEGINLTIISAARNFDYQKGIWERKWANLLTQIQDPKERALKILEYSAMPGSSRHHWGTDIDLNALTNKDFETGGTHARVYEWLQKNAAGYGFCQPYTAMGDQRSTGYNEEKWHWSYLKIARPLLQQYEQNITDSMLTGFQGAEMAPAISIVKKYVSGVACK